MYCIYSNSAAAVKVVLLLTPNPLCEGTGGRIECTWLLVAFVSAGFYDGFICVILFVCVGVDDDDLQRSDK